MLKKLALALVIVLLLGVTGKVFLLPTLTENGTSFWSMIVMRKDGGADSAVSSIVQPEEPEIRPADKLLEYMTLEQKVGQLFFARCPEEDAAEEIASLHPAGYILFARDFEDETPDSVRETIAGYQNAADIPMLIGVDEEGGSVVRLSKYRAFRLSPFQSPQELYEEGGMEAFYYDTIEKDELLHSLGINVNLAPVCDVVTNPGDYMYSRAFGEDAEGTAVYVRCVVEQMTQDKIGAVLKHFPGYGPNGDTHSKTVKDSRPMQTYKSSDFLPFQAGIEAGAGSVLMSHIVVECMDDSAPASLSPAVHEVLRGTLGFDGVVMTDDLSMDAVGRFAQTGEAAVLAVQADNDLMISSNLAEQHAAVLQAVADGTLTEAEIDAHVRRVLEWKLNLGLIDVDALAAAFAEAAAEDAA
ncbi:MAG: glycoside hydrolase family 3 protein [Butyricicoccus sp.]